MLLLLLPFLLGAATATAGNDPLIELISALRTGDARLIAAAALSLTMVGLAGLRSRVKWFRGDRGGAVLVLLLALLGALATSIAAGVPIDYKLFLTAIEIAMTAVGGFTWLKRVVSPSAVSSELEVQSLVPRPLAGTTDHPLATVPQASTGGALPPKDPQS